MTHTIYILAHDENIFHPRFFNAIINSQPQDYTIMGAAMTEPRNTLAESMRYVLRMAGLSGFIKLGLGVILQKARTSFQDSHLSSVGRVFRHHNIAVDETDHPNNSSFLDALTAQKPDVLFCATPYILKERILKLPALACVNRHAGKLPDYRGVEPVFQALRCNEKKVSVTYHTMAKKIDSGTILWEHEESVYPKDTVYGIYARLFTASAAGFWDALQTLSAGEGRTVDTNQGAYYSFPTGEQVKDFRQLGWRYV